MIKKGFFICSLCFLFLWSLILKGNVMAMANLVENRKQLDLGEITWGRCPKHHENGVFVEAGDCRIIQIRQVLTAAQKKKTQKPPAQVRPQKKKKTQKPSTQVEPQGCCKYKDKSGRWKEKPIDHKRCQRKNQQDRDNLDQKAGNWWWDSNCP